MSAQAPTEPVSLNRDSVFLYITIVVIWGLSWLPLKYQVGVVEPPVSIAYRFFAASAIMFVIAYWKKQPLKFTSAYHLRFALLGICIFSSNFMLFYYASSYLVSGILSIIFATATLFNVLNARLWLKTKTNGRTILGVILGLFGLCLVFWPEVQNSYETGNTPLFGLALCLGGTFCFSSGNIVSLSLQKQSISLVSATSWGMLYGALFMSGIALCFGMKFTFDPNWTYVISLVYLIFFASVIAFLTYLTLLKQIGPSRAAYATILFPVCALLLSTFVEDYQWTWIAALGVTIILCGNILVLKQKS